MDRPPAYTVHEADIARDREVILGLWRGNLGEDARMARKYDWFYRGCPFGEPLTLLLRHEESGEWVGVASAGRRPMLMGGHRVQAGVLVDLTVLPAHRSLWPALSLQMALMEAGLKRFDLLYGFPNPKAAALFRRVGYIPLCSIVRWARVLRHAEYAKRRLPGFLAAPLGLMLDLVDVLRLRVYRGGLESHWQDQADEEMAGLWPGDGAVQGTAGVRDLGFLRWRFDESPLVDVRYLVVRDAAGVAQAWFACESRGKAMYVHDLWTRGGVGGPSRAELAALLHSARASGHASVSVELGETVAGDAWGACGFAGREKRPVFWHPSEGLGDEFTSRLWLTAADEDE